MLHGRGIAARLAKKSNSGSKEEFGLCVFNVDNTLLLFPKSRMSSPIVPKSKKKSASFLPCHLHFCHIRSQPRPKPIKPPTYLSKLFLGHLGAPNVGATCLCCPLRRPPLSPIVGSVRVCLKAPPRTISRKKKNSCTHTVSKSFGIPESFGEMEKSISPCDPIPTNL
jgi:hypothetical protein